MFKSWVLWLCPFAGLALGPGYFVYAGFFGGMLLAVALGGIPLARRQHRTRNA